MPTDAELRIAQAQLVGWLEGLFHGIQATLFAQQLAARQQLEQLRQLPPGAMPQMRPGGEMSGQQDRPGTYLSGSPRRAALARRLNLAGVDAQVIWYRRRNHIVVV